MIAKISKQLKYPSIGDWIKKMWYIYVCVYIYIYISPVFCCVCVCVCVYMYSKIVLEYKQSNFAIYSNVYRLGGHYAKWNKLDRERQILYDVTYIWNLKSITNVNIT